ncbi:MAG: hypothetical protein JNJ52_09640 [Flavobacterium sp.]|nr:hypothetical protein [Flavobacterium sp.]
MKSVLITFLFLFSTIVVGQDINAKEVFPELFQMKLPVTIPNTQRVDEDQVFFKKGKLKNLTLNEHNQEICEVTLKNDLIFKGEVKKRHSDGAFSFKNGTIKFSNGDSYEGDFFEGKPVNGTYNFANGDKAVISSYKIYDSPSSYSGMKVPTDKRFTFTNGDILDYKANDEFEFIATDGTKIKSNFDNRYQFIGKTYYRTKEGYEYSGEMFAFGPSGKWKISNQYGSFTVEFSYGFGNTVDGFIPIKSPNGAIEWCEYKKSKLVRKAMLLVPNVYCLLGDCQNGESIVLVNKDPEFDLSYELSGTFKNGNPIGDFTAIGKDPMGYEYTIIGPIKDYKFHGKCAKVYNNYKIAFTGEYQNGLPLKGNFTVNEKLVEIKNFKDGKYIGKQIFPRENQYQNNSRYYEGEFDFYGHIQGSGTVYFVTGYKLNASDWNDGKSSNCTFTTPDNYSESDFYCNIYGGSYYRSLGNQKELDYYAAKRAEEEKARQQDAANQIQFEHQCGQCNGQGVIKVQCPMCKGAGYRKDRVTYDRHTGNTGGLAKCSHCAGTGQYTVMGCSKCDGKGFVKK